jgi:hypothetical protein
MSITPFLDGFNFDPEAKRVMGVAFEMTCAALKLAHRADIATKIIAEKIIALTKDGERDPNQLCERALNDLRGPTPSV